MTVTYGDVRKGVLKLLDDYTSRGAILSAVKVADYGFKIQDECNSETYDLASSDSKLPKTLVLVHNPIKNSTSDDTSSTKNHLPGTDFSIVLVNAKSCFFEATKYGEVVLEQSSDGVTYTTIETITVPSTTEGFAEYRRLITPSSATNTVRLRFTGSYPYSFRNYVLYANSWPTEADVEQHRPWWKIVTPTDFLDLNYVEVKKDNGQYVPYSNMVKTVEGQLSFFSYDGPMELLIHYWRKPTLLTFTNVQATDDALVIDLRDDAALTMKYGIAGTIQNSEEANRGNGFLDQYARKRARLIQIKPITRATPNLNKW